MTHKPDLDALMCALILAPGTYSRNRFFELFQDPEAQRTRRRARRVRSIIAQLTEPWPISDDEGAPREPRAELLGERVLEDGRVLFRYRMKDLEYTRTTSLAPLEAAALRFALHRAGRGEIPEDDRRLVEGALARLTSAA